MLTRIRVRLVSTDREPWKYVELNGYGCSMQHFLATNQEDFNASDQVHGRRDRVCKVEENSDGASELGS